MEQDSYTSRLAHFTPRSLKIQYGLPFTQRFRIRGGKSKKLNQFCPADKQGQVLEEVLSFPEQPATSILRPKSSTEKGIPS